MKQQKENSDYIEYCKNIIENITTCKITERIDYNKDGYVRKPQLTLTSSSHPLFTILHNRIYTDKYKGLDPHIFKLFDWECLAILFMSDGCSCYKKGYINRSENVLCELKDTYFTVENLKVSERNLINKNDVNNKIFNEQI